MTKFKKTLVKDINAKSGKMTKMSCNKKRALGQRNGDIHVCFD